MRFLRLALVAGFSFTTMLQTANPAVALSADYQCDARGVSIDQDPKGMNVREQASGKAKVIGKIYSAPDDDGDKLLGPDLAVLGFANGWVLIRNSELVTPSIDPTFQKRNYVGTGWVSAKLVQGLLYIENIDSPHNKAYAKPSFDAAVVDPDGNTNVTIAADGQAKPLIVGCQQKWLQLTYRQSGYLDSNKKWVLYTKAQLAKRKPITGWLTSREGPY